MNVPSTLALAAQRGFRRDTLVRRSKRAATLVLAAAVLAVAAPDRAAAQAPVAGGAAGANAILPRQEVITLKVGERKQVLVDVAASAAGPLRYESGNTGFFTVDAQGMLTGVHEGASTVSVIAVNGAYADIRVEVQPAAAAGAPAAAAKAGQGVTASRGVADEGIVLGNAGGNIPVGSAERIIAHVLPYQVIGSNPFKVTSSDPSVLAVNDDAKVVSALKEGTATVTVATLNGKFQASATYTVVPAVVESHPADKTYTIEPAKFGLRYDDASEEAATANSAGLYAALQHTAAGGFTRLLLEPQKTLYVEPKQTIHMVSNVQLDLNGSEIKLRPNDYPRYVAFLFAEKDGKRVLENASIVNGTLTGERDEKDKLFPKWKTTPETEGGCTIVFDEGRNNGIRNLTVRKSIGFNMSSGLGSKSHGVRPYGQSPVSVGNMELGGFDEKGEPAEAKGLIRTKKPLDVSKFQTPHYTLGYPLGYMGYPYMNSRIYDAYFFDKDMKLLSSTRGALRFRQYELPAGAAFLHLAFYQDAVPPNGNSDFGNAFAFVENRAMPIDNYMIDCVIEDNYSCGFAACGGQGWLIKGNTFRNNGGRMPGCDIDWEDGWEYMQGDLVENNTFESRVNVIACAGAGFIFRNNTFRGESTFWGRTQSYSLLNNVFEKGAGEKPQAVKVSYSSQTDIYSVGNTYKNATVGYARQHAKPPHVGTYEATFTGETFENTAITNGHLTRLVNCTISSGSDNLLIGAEQLENCTIEKGSYTVGGVIRNSTIKDATFRVLADKLLTVRDSTLTNPSFTAGAKCEGVLVEDCKITIAAGEQLFVPNNMASIGLKKSTVTIENGTSNYALVGGWNATGAETAVTFDQVRFTVPGNFQGFLHKFAWYPPATESAKISYDIRNTNLAKFRRTDEKGERSNAVFKGVK